jgi:tetratricopeptide (TPR) repeat protein
MAVELEPPELDEIDADASSFKRRVALIVVLITLFASVVAYLHSKESNLEDNAAREAQISSITGFGQQVDASTQFQADYEIFVQRQLLARRQTIAGARSRSVGNGGSRGPVYRGDNQRYGELGTALAGDSQIGALDQVSAVDAQLGVDPDKARLTHEVNADRANDHGNKADSYVALLTVLAVGLFLIGLSLTVSGRGRYLLAAPGVALAIVCVGWCVKISAQPVTSVSESAIDHAAEGKRLQASGDAGAAVEEFTSAVDDSPDFAAAWARLSDAEFTAGGDRSLNANFQSVSSEKATQRAIDAGEEAIRRGSSDLLLRTNLGFFHFTLGQLDQAEALAQGAVNDNDQIASIWFNLGVVQVAKGEKSAALDSYSHGLEIAANQGDLGLSLDVIAAARTDLEIALRVAPKRKDLVDTVNGRLAGVEAKLLAASGERVPEKVASDAAINNGEITDRFFELIANYDTTGLDDNTLLLNVWYFKPLGTSSDTPFVQLSGLDSKTLSGTGTGIATSGVDNQCLAPGDYRVEVYAGERRLGSIETHYDESPLGKQVEDGGDDVGFTLCAPESWTAPAKEVNGLTRQNPDDLTQTIRIFVVPASSEVGSDRNAFLDATIAGFLNFDQATQTGPSSDRGAMLGRTASDTDVQLDSRSVPALFPDGEVGLYVVSLGSDNVVRAIILSAKNPADLETVRSRLVNSARFLRVPD